MPPTSDRAEALPDAPVLLYRGTTRGWPGSRTSQRYGITCTTTDPVVATLFAIENRNHGQAVVLAAIRGRFEELPFDPEDPSQATFTRLEAAVNLRVAPVEFEAQAGFTLDADDALRWLGELGVGPLPGRIWGYTELQRALLRSLESGQRLNERALIDFAGRFLGGRRR